LGIAVGLVALAALRAVVEPAPAAPPRQGSASRVSLRVAAFAESFARVYLSWDADRPEQRERLLSAYLVGDLDPDAGLAPPVGQERAVGWTTAVSVGARGERTNVTVAAEAGGGLVYLSVPVRQDGRGSLSVPAYPALVGPTVMDTGGSGVVEREVDDSRLRAVCERAVGNYLAGEQRNLAADLTPAAVVSLPSQQLRLRSVDSVTWAQAGRWAAVQVQAEGRDRSSWTLRYELRVERRERWYVRAIQTDPRAKGGA